MGDLSDNFSASEFRCSCCGKVEIRCKLVIALEDLRSSIGRPMRILSGYRCERHNREVGGASNSRHLISDAADIWVVGSSLWKLVRQAQCVKAFENGGIGLYPPYKDGDRWRGNFLHVDTRGHSARWGKIGDQYISFSAALKIVEEYEKNISEAKRLITGGKK